MIRRLLVTTALAVLFALPAQAGELSRADVRKLVTTMEHVSDRFGPEALTEPAKGDAKLAAALKKRGYTQAAFAAEVRRVLRAYETLRDDPDLAAELDGGDEDATNEESGGGLFGSLLSADTLSSVGNAALFGGGDALEEVGKQAAVDTASGAAADALGDDAVGAAAMGVGQSAAYGGLDAVKQTGGQIAVDAAAHGIAGAFSGDAGAADGAAATDPALRADLEAVAPFVDRIAAALGE